MIARNLDDVERSMGICGLSRGDPILHEGVLPSCERKVRPLHPPYVSNQQTHLAFLDVCPIEWNESRHDVKQVGPIEPAGAAGMHYGQIIV